MRTAKTFLLLQSLATLGLVSATARADDLPLSWNLKPQVVTLFQDLEAGGQGSMAFVADSLGLKHNSLNWWMRDRFWADYGMSGDGYLAVGKGFTGSLHGPRDGLTNEASPAGIYLAHNAGDRGPQGAFCPDGVYTRLYDEGYFQLRLYGPSCRLWYRTQPGGGLLRITVSGQTVAEVPTAGPFGHASMEFDVGPDPLKIKVVRFSSADGRPIDLRGIDMRADQPGYTQHRLARGGSGPFDFNTSNTPETAAILASVDPGVVIVMLDWVGEDTEKSTFVDDTRELLDFYQAALPEARFILMSHHPFKDSIEQEAAWLYQIAQERDLGFINLFDTFPGGWEEMNQLGYMADSVHLTPEGGEFFGNYIYDLMKQAAICAADVNGDGLLDLFDYLSFQNLFLTEGPLADCTSDGLFDLFDFLCFQNAFAAGC